MRGAARLLTRSFGPILGLPCLSLMATSCVAANHHATLPQMIPIDPRLRVALDLATDQIRATLTVVAGVLSDTLGSAAQAHQAPSERELLNSARFELRRNLVAMQFAFDLALNQRIAQELTPCDEARRTPAATNWQSLSLVDEREVEGQLYAKRIGQEIWHACESELRDLAAYMGALLQNVKIECLFW